MDRVVTQVGQEVYEWLFSKQAQNSMVGLAKLAAAFFGTSGAVNGLACTATTVPSMQVSIGQGELYQMASLEATVCGTLPVNTSDQILKQGILLGSKSPVNLPYSSTFTPPSTAGQSINYLIEAQYQDLDVSTDPTTGASPVTLNFYNSANPSVPWSGPNNSGTSSTTFRTGSIAFQVKAGVAATTGSQTTPSADTGWIPLWVVTVAYGQTTIGNTNITTASGAPFITPGTGFTGGGGSGSYAPLASPAFTGSPTAPTATQFNSSTLLATTAYVMRAIGGYAGVQQYNTSQALTAANDANKIIFCGGSGGTYTLPTFSTVVPGTRFLLVSQGGTSSLVPNGTDSLAIAGSNVTNIAFSQGDFVEIAAGAAGWQVVGGSVLMPKSSAFQAGRSATVKQTGLTPGGVVTNTLTFTAPCAGKVMAFAMLNAGQAFAYALYNMVSINGGAAPIDYSQDSQLQVAVSSLTAGQSCSIVQTVAPYSTPPGGSFSMALSYIFVPAQ